jgi:hypothetical protein
MPQVLPPSSHRALAPVGLLLLLVFAPPPARAADQVTAVVGITGDTKAFTLNPATLSDLHADLVPYEDDNASDFNVYAIALPGKNATSSGSSDSGGVSVVAIVIGSLGGAILLAFLAFYLYNRAYHPKTAAYHPVVAPPHGEHGGHLPGQHGGGAQSKSILSVCLQPRMDHQAAYYNKIIQLDLVHPMMAYYPHHSAGVP